MKVLSTYDGEGLTVKKHNGFVVPVSISTVREWKESFTGGCT